jgi:ribosome-associated translation inhibitor RaiA
MMKILINTDRNIQGDERLGEYVEGVVADVLDRFRDRISRVEVHLSDVNAGKSGEDDKRCMMEARLEGRAPTAVTHQAGTVREAVSGAAEKLERAIDRVLGRLGQR